MTPTELRDAYLEARLEFEFSSADDRDSSKVRLDALRDEIIALAKSRNASIQFHDVVQQLNARYIEFKRARIKHIEATQRGRAMQ